MGHNNARRPLAAAAVFASALGAVAGAAGQAGATAYGDATSPVTVLQGRGTVRIVGGGTVQLPAAATGISWAGQGGRVAFTDGSLVYTADYDGSHVVELAHASPTSRTVWDPYSTAVYWTEGTGVSAKLVGTDSDGGRFGSTQETYDALPANVTDLPSGLGFSNLDVAGDPAITFVFQTTDGAGDNGIATVSSTQSGPVYKTVVAPGTAQTGGTNPTISADGTVVVFQRQVSGDVQLFASTLGSGGWSTAIQVTSLPGLHRTPTFEADVPGVAQYVVTFGFTPDASDSTDAEGVYTVAVPAAVSAGGPVAGSERQIYSGTAQELAVRTDGQAVVGRFAGTDRFDTAVRASRSVWRDTGDAADHRAQAQSVVLARSDNFADALGGAALAAHRVGPLLLTPTGALEDETKAEIIRILPVGSTVTVLGGTGAISPDVVSTLQGLGYTVVRIGGTDRFDTAVQIADAVDPLAQSILVATGTNYPDALSAGAAAASYSGTVVVLTNGGSMPAATQTYLRGKFGAGQQGYLAAVGGPAAQALTGAGWSGFDDTLGGATRYETSLNVAEKLFGAFPAVGVATGANWPDSLAGGALMGHVFGPLVLADPATGLSDAVNAFLDVNRGATNWGYVFGGTGALTSHVDDQLGADIRTADGVTTAPAPGVARRPTLQRSTPDVQHS